MGKTAKKFVMFIDGTFYQILIAVSTSMAMIKYSPYFNDSDTVSVAL